MAAKSIRRGLLTGLAAGALAVTAVPAASVTADAATAPSAADVGAAAAQQLQRQQTGTLIARRGSRVIVCRIDIRTPHRVDYRRQRMIRVVASVRCDRRVDHMRIRVQLYRDGSPVSASRSASDRRGIALGVGRRCVSNSVYRGRVRVRVDFPDGYRPSASSTTVRGAASYVRRCR